MSIVIACDSFLALRNVRNGDLLDRLAEVGPEVWVDRSQYAGSRWVLPETTHVEALEDFNPRSARELMAPIGRASLARKCWLDPGSRWIELRRSSHRHHRTNVVGRVLSTGLAWARLRSYALAGYIGYATKWRNELARTLRAHPVAESYRSRLRHMDARAVLALSPEGSREMMLVEAANSLGIPTLVMIRSRDNLSKVAHLPDATAYLVWSEVTRDFLLHLYPEIDSDRVHAVGSPQFDHHLDPAFRLGRSVFFDAIGFDENRPLVVYTMATPGLIDHEIEITQHLADAAHAGQLIGNAQLLVRGHPRMFGSDVPLLRCEYDEARVYPRPGGPPYRSAEHEATVVQWIIEDEAMHLSTLAYQDVQVNVCGTMTIDSAIFDKPTVNVHYDLVEGLPIGLSLKRFYSRADVRQMMSYGASRLAHSPDACIDLINEYLRNPTRDAAGRERARSADCGPLDGKSGARIAEACERLLRVSPQPSTSVPRLLSGKEA